jgi:hypothetical protein
MITPGKLLHKATSGLENAEAKKVRVEYRNANPYFAAMDCISV